MPGGPDPSTRCPNKPQETAYGAPKGPKPEVLRKSRPPGCSVVAHTMTCGPSLSVTTEQPASSPPQPVENGVFVAPMLPSPPPLSSELSPSFLREQIVERTVRQHEAAHAPLVQDAMRPREQPALSREMGMGREAPMRPSPAA